jgi:general secretion pathway protein D
MKSLLIILSALLSLSVNALTLNLKNMEMVTLINTVSQVTGKNFIVDPRVKGKVNVVSTTEIDDDEFYHLFLSILQVHGYIAVEGDGFAKILPQTHIKNNSSRLSATASDHIVTTTIPVFNVAANQMIPVLRPIISQHGHLASYTPSNTIIVTDTQANIARLKDVINELDKEIDKDYEVITLKNASADEVAKVIKSLLPTNKNQTGNPLTIAVDRHNNQIIVGGASSKRLKVRFLAKELDKHQDKEGGTSVVYLRYANAKDILPTLQNIAKQTMSDNKGTAQSNNNVNIQADESTNAIIITASPAISKNIKKVISKLDIRKAQVLIEAIIAEISSSDSNELGIQWLGRGSSGIGILNFTGQIPALLSGLGGDASSVASAIGKGATIGVGSFDSTTKNGFGAVLNALEGQGKVNILSTPSIVTLDNEEAMIMVGQEVPFITNTEIKSVGSNPFQNYERKDVGLKLIVKPQINEGDTIKLIIDLEISNIIPGSNASDLVTSKRKIKTSVMVADNKILVLGGLMDDIIRDSESKLPILGDIPVLGGIFSYKTKSKEKRNLLIFIHPTTLTNQNTANKVSDQKYKYIRAQQLLNDMTITKETPTKDSELPPWMNYE